MNKGIFNEILGLFSTSLQKLSAQPARLCDGAYFSKPVAAIRWRVRMDQGRIQPVSMRGGGLRGGVKKCWSRIGDNVQKNHTNVGEFNFLKTNSVEGVVSHHFLLNARWHGPQ